MSSASSAPERTRSQRLLWVTLGVAGVVVIIDQITKALAVAYLVEGRPVEVLGPVLRLNLVRNPGAAFSMGTSFTVILSLLAIGVAIVIVRTARTLGSLGWAVALGGLLGGALGNLTDRMTREPGLLRGHVIDYLQLPNWPVFNVADMAIVCSAILMGYLTIRGIGFSGQRSTGSSSSTDGGLT
ncbi:MAG: signal peptidase II [Actinomycetes bacterium]